MCESVKMYVKCIVDIIEKIVVLNELGHGSTVYTQLC